MLCIILCLLVNTGARFQLPQPILFIDILDFVICLHAVATDEVVILICTEQNVK